MWLASGYDYPVRGIRFFLTILYASYLTNVGMLLLLLPWSDAWSRFVLVIPPGLGHFMDDPMIRGIISAFGLLHILLLLVELLNHIRTEGLR